MKLPREKADIQKTKYAKYLNFVTELYFLKGSKVELNCVYQ